MEEKRPDAVEVAEKKTQERKAEEKAEAEEVMGVSRMFAERLPDVFLDLHKFELQGWHDVPFLDAAVFCEGARLRMNFPPVFVVKTNS